jgi:hypothetical protein
MQRQCQDGGCWTRRYIQSEGTGKDTNQLMAQ